MSGGTITYVEIDESGAGTAVLAAAATGKFHVLRAIVIVPLGAGTVELASNTTGLSGQMTMDATLTPIILPDMEIGWQRSVVAEALNLIFVTTGGDGIAVVETFNG